MTKVVLVGVIIAVLLIVVLVTLMRRRLLRERHALLWLVAAVVVIVFGVWPAAQEALASLLGIAYPPSALFVLIAVFAAGALLDMTISLSGLAARSEDLAQEVAILEERVRQLEDPPPDD